MSRIRKGKTVKDRENGNVERTLANRAARVAYQNVSGTPFPSFACGSKKRNKRHNSKMGK